MKIQKVEAFVLKDKLTKSFFFSQWEYSKRVICVVKVTASDGQYGWGEGYGPANVLEVRNDRTKVILYPRGNLIINFTAKKLFLHLYL
jgi:D-galactarolactone cycloisomerase